MRPRRLIPGQSVECRRTAKDRSVSCSVPGSLRDLSRGDDGRPRSDGGSNSENIMVSAMSEAEVNRLTHEILAQIARILGSRES